MRECTCYKAHIYGRCEVCRQYYEPEIINEVRELINKYPREVRELLYDMDNGK